MRRCLAAGLVLVLAACSTVQPPQPAATPAPPEPTPTAVPRTPDQVASAYFQAWQQGQYDAMYDLLSSDSQLTTPRDLFTRRYRNIHDGVSERQLAIQPSGPAQSDGTAMHVRFTATHTLDVFGDVQDTNDLRMLQDNGVWRIDWQPGLIFNGLTSTTTVRVVPESAARGKILDRAGKPLADNGSIVSVGVVPGEIKDEPAVLNALSDALGLPQDQIKPRYQGGQPTWFMPIADRLASDKDELQTKLGSIAGVALQDKPARVYPLGDAAAQLVGYVAHPTADELRQLGAQGYDESDWVGRAGLEAWAESRLAGHKGGSIQIVDQAGRVVRTIVRTPAVAGQDLHLTIDAGIQNEAVSALGDKIGSAIAMDPRDNSVLALVSRPSFDPNAFVIGLSDAQWQELNGPTAPLQLRPTEATYPTGSIFKVITMAAGMEQAGFKMSNTFDCGADWNGLPGVTLHNWEPQGTLNLTQALTESCNPAFYEIGLKLDQQDPTILPSYARTFGLGQPTHLDGVREVAGVVPDPSWKQQQLGQPWTSGDGVNLAIGQGYLLATPLQMANAYAALARGGSLLAPTLVADQQAATLGQLNVSAATLNAIVAGMQRVTSTAQGTAYYAFKDEKLAIAAKTGSAENENPDAHAWFVGYTPVQQPTLLVLVMVEGGQHGGTVAAPVARDVMDFAYPLVH
jgi:penicillin-binding protein 2